MTASHTFSAADTYQVTLTVTDNDGARASATRSVSVSAPQPPASSSIAFEAQASSTGNVPTAKVTTPAKVAAGQTLVLLASANRDTTMATPTGWTLVDGQGGPKGEVTTRVWTRTATAADGGKVVQVPFGQRSKYDLTLAAYSGVDTAAPVADQASAVETVYRAEHTTPPVTAGAGDWVLSWWTEKTSTGTGWTPPSGQVSRAEVIGIGNGRVNALLTDADNSGGSGGLTATSSAKSKKVVMWSLVLNQAGAAGSTQPPANTSPTAAFAAPSCTDLSCTVDASGSSDPDGSVVSYSWSWGDGTQDGSGVTASHTFSAADTYQVTLTVTDNDGARASATRSVSVSAPQPPASSSIAFEAQASSTGNVPTAKVTTPAKVAAGQTLVLLASANRDTTMATPTGWTLVDGQGGPKGEVTTRVWTRTATAADGGKVVQVPFGQRSKYDLTLAAYSGVDTAAPVADQASAVETVYRAEHTTPPVTAGAGDWVLSWWTEKTSTGTGWTPPSGQVSRAEVIGIGNGRVNALLTDADNSGGSGGLTATSSAKSKKVVMWSLVLNQG